jgi:F-type H+-transporting ATPase subunit gamma
MAKSRALDKRRKSIRNIRKITRTMELIATARFQKAMTRAHAATAFTDRITRLAADLARGGPGVSHPLLQGRAETKTAILLVLTGNRGLCGGYNSNVQRVGLARWEQLRTAVPQPSLEISGKRGISAFRFRGIQPAESYTHFEHKPAFAEVELLANRYLDAYARGALDRLDIAYSQFESIGKQTAVLETLLPMGKPEDAREEGLHAEIPYEFLPSAESILAEVVPASFKVKLYKCFLDAAASEQVSRMVAMKAATENADKIIKNLTIAYNRARQGQITGEIMEVLGGAEALNT